MYPNISYWYFVFYMPHCYVLNSALFLPSDHLLSFYINVVFTFFMNKIIVKILSYSG